MEDLSKGRMRLYNAQELLQILRISIKLKNSNVESLMERLKYLHLRPYSKVLVAQLFPSSKRSRLLSAQPVTDCSFTPPEYSMTATVTQTTQSYYRLQITNPLENQELMGTDCRMKGYVWIQDGNNCGICQNAITATTP